MAFFTVAASNDAQVVYILAPNSSLHPRRYISHAKLAALVTSDRDIIDIIHEDL